MMRPVQLADLETAARVVATVPAPARHALIVQLCDQARRADMHRKTCGKPHPQFGNGTLMSAAMKYGSYGRGAACDTDFLISLAALCTHLADGHTM